MAQALYSQLRDTPNTTLNNTCRGFHSVAHRATLRLPAWDAKHVSKGACARLAGDRETIQEPQMVACQISRRSWRERYHSGRKLGQHHHIYA
ncbi:hypothetical protein BGW80DRAFT_526883 [Lactifluus volemus]|nr:hypothetical protein BGW80DRAFT_526883 [Lactifluus volemus]